MQRQPTQKASLTFAPYKCKETYYRSPWQCWWTWNARFEALYSTSPPDISQSREQNDFRKNLSNRTNSWDNALKSPRGLLPLVSWKGFLQHIRITSQFSYHWRSHPITKIKLWVTKPTGHINQFAVLKEFNGQQMFHQRSCRTTPAKYSRQI